MTEKQDKMIKRIRNAVEKEINRHNERFESKKEITKFDVCDLGRWRGIDTKGTKVVYFEVNYEEGNCLTEMRGHLFVGKRGGLTGKVYTGINNESRVASGGEFYKVTMWI